MTKGMLPLFLLCMIQTDTASVLYEAINYIKWLHEQVQVTCLTFVFPLKHYQFLRRIDLLLKPCKLEILILKKEYISCFN